ncbi:hypothetical protein M8J75_003057 [Diaphorina citri]|nr:hypothetical protein M8J75_003057 [Diaphorina citri]
MKERKLCEDRLSEVKKALFTCVVSPEVRENTEESLPDNILQLESEPLEIATPVAESLCATLHEELEVYKAKVQLLEEEQEKLKAKVQLLEEEQEKLKSQIMEKNLKESGKHWA